MGQERQDKGLEYIHIGMQRHQGWSLALHVHLLPHPSSAWVKQHSRTAPSTKTMGPSIGRRGEAPRSWAPLESVITYSTQKAKIRTNTHHNLGRAEQTLPPKWPTTSTWKKYSLSLLKAKCKSNNQIKEMLSHCENGLHQKKLETTVVRET